MASRSALAESPTGIQCRGHDVGDLLLGMSRRDVARVAHTTNLQQIDDIQALSYCKDVLIVEKSCRLASTR